MKKRKKKKAQRSDALTQQTGVPGISRLVLSVTEQTTLSSEEKRRLVNPPESRFVKKASCRP
uniref:Uncharacterized protein n=1 Tax=Anguilla anguilla TaxID=7936 RepID=A0A0E9W8R4_ANGAN